MNEDFGAKAKTDFYTLLAKHNAKPSPGGEAWAKNNWFNLENVVGRICSLQHETKFKLGKDKTILCSVLGACLTAAIETRFKRRSEENAIIDSLQNLVGVLQKQLDEERNENNLLRAALREVHVKNSQNFDSSKETEEKETSHLNQNYPQKELVLMKNFGEHCCCNSMKPQIKTECNYINDEDFDPHIITKEIPYTATELTKLAKQYGLLSHKTETKSLTGKVQTHLSEQEAGGYWGHGVFLTTGDRRIPWSLIQHIAYWTEGLNPSERGNLLTIAGTPNQLLENIHKAACLQIMHERKPTTSYESPMQSPVKSKIMTSLIQRFTETLKPIAIFPQKPIAAMSPIETPDKLLSNQNNPFVPSYDLPRKGIKWDWSLSQEKALQSLIFEATAHQALDPIHPTDPFQVEWGFASSGLSVHIRQRGPEGPTRPVGFYSHGFKDAERRYSTWERGLSVVGLTLTGVEKNLAIQETESLGSSQNKLASVIKATPPFFPTSANREGEGSAQVEELLTICSIFQCKGQNYFLVGINIKSYAALVFVLFQADAFKRATGNNTVKAIQGWFGIFLTPQEIQSDNVSHFTVKSAQDWAKGEGIEWTSHTPYDRWGANGCPKITAFCLTAPSIIPSLHGPDDFKNPAHYPGQPVFGGPPPIVGEVPLVLKTSLTIPLF